VNARLFVGGSRGAGEVAAKLIAAGGGDATITYAASRTEAARVVSEIRGGDGAARDIQLDVTAGRKMIGAAITELDDISMLVYCAIPPVLPGKPDTFDHDEFRRHVAVSVEGAYDLVSELVPKMRAGGACIFPSSVYLERPDAGFVEYRAAKAAGEAMWQSLAAAYPTLRFVSPRLPRMRTDQTASIRPMDVADTAEVILSLLRDVREPANPREMGVPDAPRGLP
jgi:NAD(P)-dependent dehydrogenase (short-subunit alcohol dehydrogenase family)